MGYELHVVRAEAYGAWAVGEPLEDPISFEEWDRFADAHDDLLVGGSDGDLPVYLYRTSSTGQDLSFTWTDGAVVVNGGYGTPAEMDELVRLAQGLGARLFGDEGEQYEIA